MRNPVIRAFAIAVVSCWSAPGHPDEQRPVTCANSEAIYEGIANANYEMIFHKSAPEDEMPGMAGMLRMRKGQKTVEFRFKEEPSNGLSRNYVSLEDDEDVISMIMRLNGNLTQSLTGPEGEAAPFVITPDLAVKFYYSKLPDHRSPEMIPPETWKLVGCNKQ